MKLEHKMLENKIQDLSNKIDKLPKGNLICAKNTNNYKWYFKNDSKISYLSKKHRLLAEQLALKKYYLYLKSDLQREKEAIEKYLNFHYDQLKSHKLIEHPEYNKLLKNNLLPEQADLLSWSKDDFTRNPVHLDALQYPSPSGNILRSKSEAMIDMMLYTNKIPFRYECQLVLDGINLYPDFTIRHPKTGKIYYWEHFGMIDKKDYLKNTISKLHRYGTNNIFPSINLITTFETESHPLNNELISKIIEYYFL